MEDVTVKPLPEELLFTSLAMVLSSSIVACYIFYSSLAFSLIHDIIVYKVMVTIQIYLLHYIAIDVLDELSMCYRFLPYTLQQFCKT